MYMSCPQPKIPVTLEMYVLVSLWEHENPIKSVRVYSLWTVILFVVLYVYIPHRIHTFLKIQIV